MIPIPTQDELDKIREKGLSKSIFSRIVGPYHLSVIYRESSAMLETPSWFPEAMIFTGQVERDEAGKIIKFPRIEWQGEGWASFLHLANNLGTAEQVKVFLMEMSDDE